MVNREISNIDEINFQQLSCHSLFGELYLPESDSLEEIQKLIPHNSLLIIPKSMNDEMKLEKLLELYYTKSLEELECIK